MPLARPGAGKTRTSKAGLFRAAANFFPSSHPNPPGSQNLFSSRLPALSISSTLTAEPGHSPLHSLFSSLEFFLNKPSRWRLARRISKSWACRYVVAIPPENRSLPSRTVRPFLQRASPSRLQTQLTSMPESTVSATGWQTGDALGRPSHRLGAAIPRWTCNRRNILLTHVSAVLRGRLPEYVSLARIPSMVSPCQARMVDTAEGSAPQLVPTQNKLLTCYNSGWRLRRRLEDRRCPH